MLDAPDAIADAEPHCRADAESHLGADACPDDEPNTRAHAVAYAVAHSNTHGDPNRQPNAKPHACDRLVLAFRWLRCWRVLQPCGDARRMRSVPCRALF